MRTLSFGVLLIAACAFVVGCNEEETTKGPGVKAPTSKTGGTKMTAAKAQTMCPVSGKAIDKDQFVDYQGKRVYFCCGKCPAEFNKDPGKYVAEMEEKGITLEKAPEAPKGPATTKAPATPK